MKASFDKVSIACSKLTTREYSTSFSLGIYFLNHKMRDPIYAIYGFVRFADEIVDSFEGYNKTYLLKKFKQDTYEAIENKISLNPILNAFQQSVHDNNISLELIDTFLKSMEMMVMSQGTEWTASSSRQDLIIVDSKSVFRPLALTTLILMPLQARTD